MNLIYHDTTKVYSSLPTFVSTGIVAGDPVIVLLAFDMSQIFTLAKERTALRGRFATAKEGDSLLDKIAMTDDERDWFDRIMKSAGSEVYNKLSAWTKGVEAAYRHKVKFGTPVFSGSVSSVATAVITDSTKSFTVNELATKKLIITSPGADMNQERTISSNTATTITLASGFTADVTGLNYVIVTTSSDYLLFHLNLDLRWDLNIFEIIDKAIEEALVLYAVKEWYRINRLGEDYGEEEESYRKELTNIRSQILRYTIPARRATDFFQ